MGTWPFVQPGIRTTSAFAVKGAWPYPGALLFSPRVIDRRTARELEASLLPEVAALRAEPTRWDAGVERLVQSLCELAVDDDKERAALGQRLLFSEVAEPLGDAFSHDQADLYERVFAQVIDFCRRLPRAGGLRRTLERFGLHERSDILHRRTAAGRTDALTPARCEAVRKAFVLSRITLGADVAVTSLVIQKLQRTFPNAECVLLGPPALEAVTGGATRLRIREQTYDRRGGLLGRLGSWERLVETIDDERAGLDAHECVVVDPDSRLTQLGLLPVAEPAVPAYFFESRRFQRPGLARLGQLTVAWLDEVFGSEGGELYPRVWLRPSDLAAAESVVTRLRSRGARDIVAVNLGVGENPRKRIHGSFERDLIHRLVADGHALMLDKGIGEERVRVGEIVASLEPLPPEVFVYEGGVGPFAALISRSDFYVGYDSAFQHIAAAQSVPIVDMFVEAPSPAFADRWEPSSKASVNVVRLRGDMPVAEAVTQVVAAIS